MGTDSAASKREPLAILNGILPASSKKNASAIASTQRGRLPTIPRSDLHTEIGSRVSNTKTYGDAFEKAKKNKSEVLLFGKFERKSFGKQQPPRADFERMLLDTQPFVDVEIDPS